MKRSSREADSCDLAESNFANQYSTELAKAAGQVFGSHDLVPNMIAPLLDLRSLFNLSRVNRRLQKLLYWTPTLEKVRHYKGTLADFPKTLLAHLDVRISRYMSEGPWVRNVPRDLERERLDETDGWTREELQLEYILEQVVSPLVFSTAISDDDLTEHMTAIHAGILCSFSTKNFDYGLWNLERIRMAECVTKQVARRVKSIPVFKWFFDELSVSPSIDYGEYYGLLHRFALVSQTGANTVVRDHCMIQMGHLNPKNAASQPLLFSAIVSDNVSHFESEYIRLGKCTSIGVALAAAAMPKGPNGRIFSHLLKTATRRDVEGFFYFPPFPSPACVFF